MDASTSTWDEGIREALLVLMRETQKAHAFLKAVGGSCPGFVEALRDIEIQYSWAFEGLVNLQPAEHPLLDEEEQVEHGGMVFTFGVIDTEDPWPSTPTGADQPPEEPDDGALDLGEAA